MKKLLVLMLFIALCGPMVSAADADEGVRFDDLVRRDGLFYKKFSIKPFTGTTVGERQHTFRNGLRDGKSYSFYGNGNLSSEGEYKNGKEMGEHKSYYPDGNLKSKTTYKNSKRNGPTIFFYENGNIHSEGLHWDDKWTGEWKLYHKDGRLDLTGETCYILPADCAGSGIYSNGKKVGNLD